MTDLRKPQKKRLGLLAVIVLAIVAACLASVMYVAGATAAGRVCGERLKMATFLKKRYKERPHAMGVSASGKTVMEIYKSEKGSWTVLMTTLKGISCIMGAGHSWDDAPTPVSKS